MMNDQRMDPSLWSLLDRINDGDFRTMPQEYEDSNPEQYAKEWDQYLHPGCLDVKQEVSSPFLVHSQDLK